MRYEVHEVCTGACKTGEALGHVAIIAVGIVVGGLILYALLRPRKPRKPKRGVFWTGKSSDEFDWDRDRD